MIKFSGMNMRIVEFSKATSTAGTNQTVAHGLPFTPHSRACHVQPYTDSADTTDDAQTWAIAGTNATNVIIRPSRTLGIACKGRLFIMLDSQDATQNSAV